MKTRSSSDPLMLDCWNIHSRSIFLEMAHLQASPEPHPGLSDPLLHGEDRVGAAAGVWDKHN